MHRAEAKEAADRDVIFKAIDKNIGFKRLNEHLFTLYKKALPEMFQELKKQRVAEADLSHMGNMFGFNPFQMDWNAGMMPYMGAPGMPGAYGMPLSGFGMPPGGFGMPPGGFGMPPGGFGMPPGGFGMPPGFGMPFG
eukprot:m.537115 g.537115  ORF g.537115 m.537115 type:complete len:137 (+) comp57625_c0_seq2:849-1259(+)